MNTTTKHKKDEFLVIPLKQVNRPGTPKLWVIAHENRQKTRKRRVFGCALKHVPGLTVVVNHPRTPKLREITNENSPKMQKRQVFGHHSQSCKSPFNSKTMGNSS